MMVEFHFGSLDGFEVLRCLERNQKGKNEVNVERGLAFFLYVQRAGVVFKTNIYIWKKLSIALM